ncbi:hypothetical protein [Agromyces arachidis]|uniref:hypothetical protein n=1 Tax=Agromyces arachidis TaxID=766966 RepID=UPI004055DF3D
MTASTDDRSAIDAFAEASALWLVGDSPPAFLIDAAVEAVVAGVDAPDLHELAGLSDADEAWELRAALERALADLGLPVPDPAPETRPMAMRALAALLLRDRISVRELLDWSRGVIGDADPGEARRFLEIGGDLDAGRITPHEAQLAAIDESARYLHVTAPAPDA